MTTTTEIDLQRFCDPTSSRMTLGKPFVKDGLRCGCDARVLVCISAPGEPDTEGRLPKIRELLADNIGDLKPWPRVEICSTCQGKGETEKTCDSCFGDGKCDRCPCEHVHDCGYCDGTGMATDVCDCRAERIDFDGVDVSRYYTTMIGTLPNVRYWLDSKDKVRFVFDGNGEGVVMAICKDKD